MSKKSIEQRNKDRKQSDRKKSSEKTYPSSLLPPAESPNKIQGYEKTEEEMAEDHKQRIIETLIKERMRGVKKTKARYANRDIAWDARSTGFLEPLYKFPFMR